MYSTTKPYIPKILNILHSTSFNTDKITVNSDLSWKLNPSVLNKTIISHTDGIGTKGQLIFEKTKKINPEVAVQDAMAMNLNDLLCLNATPITMSAHLHMPVDDHPLIIEITRLLALACATRGILFTGGETSIDGRFDISLTFNALKNGDGENPVLKNKYALIGFPSNGFHSNGFTFLKEEIGYDIPNLEQPTRVYYDELKWLNESRDKPIKFINITGGGLSRLKQLNGFFVFVNIEESISSLSYEEGYVYGRLLEKAPYAVFNTLNCGIGLIGVFHPLEVNSIITLYPESRHLGFIDAQGMSNTSTVEIAYKGQKYII